MQRIRCSSPSSFTFHSLFVTIYRIYVSLLSSHSHLLRAGMKSKHTVTLLKSYIHSIRIIPKHKHSLPQVLLSQPPFGSNHKPVTFQVSQRKRAHRMEHKNQIHAKKMDMYLLNCTISRTYWWICMRNYKSLPGPPCNLYSSVLKDHHPTEGTEQQRKTLGHRFSKCDRWKMYPLYFLFTRRGRSHSVHFKNLFWPMQMGKAIEQDLSVVLHTVGRIQWFHERLRTKPHQVALSLC